MLHYTPQHVSSSVEECNVTYILLNIKKIVQ